MPNQQLVDYIKQQSQGGVAKDAVKSALLAAGWPETDVTEAMNAALPAAAVPNVASPAAKPATVNLAGAMGGMNIGPETRPSESFRSVAPVEKKSIEEDHGGHKELMPMIVMGSVIVLLLAALGYVYFSLSGKLADANIGANPGASAELTALQEQVKSLTDEKTNTTTQLTALSEEQQKLMTEISFFAVPSSGSLTQDIEGKAQGTLSGGGAIPYTITTPHQLRVYVKNWKDAKVDAVLKPLLGASVEISGMHKPTSPDLTVTAVNGAPVNPPAPAATSTAPASTSTTP